MTYLAGRESLCRKKFKFINCGVSKNINGIRMVTTNEDHYQQKLTDVMLLVLILKERKCEY